MPSHSKCKSAEQSHGHGGPLKRTGAKADDWETCIGPSLESIPALQFPTVRTILQRYRSLRIEQPGAPISTLAKRIADEVKVIWDKARVPTISVKSCVRKVVSKIELWNSQHNPGEHSEGFRTELASLFDLAPKLRGSVAEDVQLDHLRDLMRQASDMQRRTTEGDQYDWQIDFDFYMDQYRVSVTIDVIVDVL